VITRCRDTAVNLRTQLTRIVGRAGLTPWPKLWQNLRSTRETELAEAFPMHVVCRWIGNSQPVAAKHYLQVTDEHYEQAATGTGDAEDAAQKAAQIPAQNISAPTRTDSHAQTAESQNDKELSALRNDADPCDDAELLRMGEAGFEPARACRPRGF